MNSENEKFKRSRARLNDKKIDEEFSNLDRSSVYDWTDEKLAQFQAQSPSGSPQHILAIYEWQRRLVACQVKATQLSTILGILGTVVGTVLGVIVGHWITLH